MTDMLAQLSPEERAKFMAAAMRLGTAEDTQNLLKQQLAQGESLRQSTAGKRYYGALAGGLGGLGDAMTHIAGVIESKKAEDAQRKNIGQMGQDRGGLMDWLFGGQPGALPQGMDVPSAPQAMGMGTQVTPSWGLDLSQPELAVALRGRRVR